MTPVKCQFRDCQKDAVQEINGRMICARHRVNVSWSYKSTVKRNFKLTDEQIALAVQKGLLRTKQARNPHYSSAPPATLINVEDINKNIEEILRLSKSSESMLDRERAI